MSAEELVLGLPRMRVEELFGRFQGVASLGSDRYEALRRLTNVEACSFRKRADCEHDPSWKQIIPYVCFTHKDPDGDQYLLRYNRTQLSGEKRLAGLASIGVGGHVNWDDLQDQEEAVPSADAYFKAVRACAIREIQEEVVLDTVPPLAMYPQALINDDSNDVGKVHLGVLYVAQLALPCVYPRDGSICRVHWRRLSQLQGSDSTLAEFESWSREVLSSDVLSGE